MARTFGVTVMPEWAQAEGIAAVLDRLQAAGVNAIATSPYVMAPAEEGEGGREPPIDAGAGSVRLLDRPLWGKRELWCQTAPSFAPDRQRYRGLRYQPPEPDGLTAREGAVVARFLEAAKARGMEVQLQVQAAIPPGYRVQFGADQGEDELRLPDGGSLARRVDRNASLASAEVRGYLGALLADLAAAYPMVDAIRIDWPEYPPYTLEAAFTDFSPPAQQAAARLGYDVEAMRAEAAGVLAGLRAGTLDLEALDRLGDLWRFKADLVVELLQVARDALPPAIRLVPQSFPRPWALLSGFDHARAATVVEGMGVKLYTMHWPMMARFWAEALGGVDAARRIVRFLDVGGPEPQTLDDLRYPEPEEAHPVGAEAQRRKLEAAVTAAAPCPVYAFAHSYGPLEDVVARFRLAWEAPVAGVWVNRYGYLSDAKIKALGGVVSGGPPRRGTTDPG